jgi:hypothetical protein
MDFSTMTAARQAGADIRNNYGGFAHRDGVKRLGTMVICVTASLGNAPSEWMGM